MGMRSCGWRGPAVVAAVAMLGCVRPVPTDDAPASDPEPVEAEAPQVACEQVCVVEVENRTAYQLDIVLRDGLSVRTLGQVAGFGSVSVEVPVGMLPRQIGARIPPGALSSARGAVSCHYRNQGGVTARLVCEQRR